MPTLNALSDLGYEIDGFMFGSGTPYVVYDLDYGTPTVTVNDRPIPRGDGVMFGADYFGSRTLTFSIIVSPEWPVLGTGPEAADLFAALAGAWRADDVRRTPGRVSTLRLCRSGRTRRVYGRPRRFSSASEADEFGWFVATAEFVVQDDLFYGDGEYSNTLSIVPPPAGGLVSPLIEPLSTLGVSYEPGVIDIAGQAPAWLVIIIRGPITNPTVRLVDGWTIKLNTTVRAGEWIGIDPRPWSRGVRLNGVTPVAGLMDWSSPRLEDLSLPPGRHEVVLGGTDLTGTAQMTVAWRPAYATY